MPQITFTCNEQFMSLIAEIDEIAEKDGRSRSGMIVLLLHQALKERKRKRNGKPKNYFELNALDMGKGDAAG